MKKFLLIFTLLLAGCSSGFEVRSNTTTWVDEAREVGRVFVLEKYEPLTQMFNKNGNVIIYENGISRTEAFIVQDYVVSNMQSAFIYYVMARDMKAYLYFEFTAKATWKMVYSKTDNREHNFRVIEEVGFHLIYDNGLKLGEKI